MKYLYIILFLIHSLAYASYDSIIQKYRDQKNFQGTVLIAKKNQILFHQGFGIANQEYQIPNAPETNFLVGSVSKQFTAALILKLQEEGLLSVQDKISNYLAVPKSWEAITIHQLLTHTAGIVRDVPLTLSEYGNYHNLETLFKSIITEPLLADHAPGKYSYSNAGYSTLAYLVEVISKKDFTTYFLEELTIPNQLFETGNYHMSSIIPNRATGYVYKFNLLYSACCFDHSNALGAGSNYSNATDLLQWIENLQSNKFLSKASTDLMFTRHTTQDGSYGYGWVISEFENRRMIFHNGHVEGFYSDVSFFPEDHITIILLTNLNHYTYDQSAQKWIMDYYLGELRKELLKEIP